MLGRARLVLWAIIGATLLVIAALYVSGGREGPVAGDTQSITGFGGPFTLTGTDGKPFASGERLRGKPFALFFGFTHCPDVCPTTLARLAKLRRELGKGDDVFAILFVTVDPERDTPAAMRDYAKAFATPVIGLTGSPTEIAQVEKQWGIYAKKAPQPGGDYSMDHTATVFLVDRDGHFRSTIDPREDDAPAMAKLKRLAA